MEQLQGVRDTALMFDAIPNAAQHEFADVMGRLGRDILALQRARAPKDTGNLAAGLTSQLIVHDKLVRLRVGMLGVEATSKSALRRAAQAGGGDPRNLGNIYYGRFVEYGRSAQTVLVERRRRIDGKLRTLRGKKRAEDLAATYTLKVKARAAAPFIQTPDGEVDQLVGTRLETFWDRVVTRAEAL